MESALVQSISVASDGQAKSSSYFGGVALGSSVALASIFDRPAYCRPGWGRLWFFQPTCFRAVPTFRSQPRTGPSGATQPACSIQKYWALAQRAKLLFLCLGVSLLIGLVSSGSAHCQDQPQLPAEFKPALDAINQRSITATINFLASDEMRGRDTPSRELTIASAYVAARFKAAGLTGLGEKGSFYQATQIATTAVPQAGVRLSSDGKTISHYGLLSAGAEAMSFNGSVVALSGRENRDVTFAVAKAQPRFWFKLTQTTCLLARPSEQANRSWFKHAEGSLAKSSWCPRWSLVEWRWSCQSKLAASRWFEM